VLGTLCSAPAVHRVDAHMYSCVSQDADEATTDCKACVQMGEEAGTFLLCISMTGNPFGRGGIVAVLNMLDRPDTLVRCHDMFPTCICVAICAWVTIPFPSSASAKRQQPSQNDPSA
jgi:hypothetical protein